ncbi:GIY-YIG nuclease family protein [Cytobacillus suaedae]|nr:GIY-YIG nuclease family protein [Cytobacillus suaedae]
MTIVNVRWYGPYSLENFCNKETSLYNGIYAIYRVFGGKETLLYIGKTSRDFSSRISEHNKHWLWGVKGYIQIRVGILEFPNGGKFSLQKLSDVESLLILWHLPKENTASTVYYRGRFSLEVYNVGRRGLIDKKVSADDLIWA